MSKTIFIHSSAEHKFSDTSSITIPLPPLALEPISFACRRIRLVKATISNASPQPLAILCDCVDPSLVNGSLIPIIGFAQTIGPTNDFSSGFPSVSTSVRQLSSIKISLWNVEKNCPAIPMKGRRLKALFVIEIQ